jgi:hypothetical protein
MKFGTAEVIFAVKRERHRRSGLPDLRTANYNKVLASIVKFKT